MFRKTRKSEFDLFNASSSMISKRTSQKYDTPQAWKNQFYRLGSDIFIRQVLMCIKVDGNVILKYVFNE